LEDIIRAMTLAGAATDAFGELLKTVMPLFNSADQAMLQAALQDARTANDAGHRRLQAKLKAAAGR